MKKINIVTLGCSKNIVDSERLLHQISLNGIDLSHDESGHDADIVIINTCGFINAARKESIDTILRYVKAKNDGEIKKLFVIGCLSEKYGNSLKEEIPEVDNYYGVNCIEDVISTLKLNYYKNRTYERWITTPQHYAYLKISEGCNRKCSFCSIPIIRGSFKSKPVEIIMSEAEYLAGKGVKEMILIAQDLTYYGIDIYDKPIIHELVSKISEIAGVEWIRLHYAYPSNFPFALLKTINENPKVCKYIDIPFQHISNNVLQKMHRGINSEQTQYLIDRIRSEVHGISIRTTLLVGHPGETDNDFDMLKAFVIKNKFEKLGVFTYSHEDGTYSSKKYKDEITLKTKHKREFEIMSIQKEISLAHNLEKVNNKFKVLIDRAEGDFFVGRTEFDSPEVDNEVLVKSNTLTPGDFYTAKVISTDEYDLYAEIV